MNIDEYLNLPVILDFIRWIAPRLDKANSFNHSYKNWYCNSIYNAYEQYDWENKNFVDTQKELSTYRNDLNEALSNSNAKEVKKACISILKWGGVEIKNRETVERNDNIVNCLLRIKEEIAPCNFNTAQNISKIKINSGFSKIYSLLVDNFIIYDSRVSTALCYLVRLFCEQNSCQEVDENLRFAFTSGRDGEKKRNPNANNYKFHKLSSSNYLKNNIKASWLLMGILEKTKSRFNDLPQKIQLRALEAALFMIGYDIKDVLTKIIN